MSEHDLSFDNYQFEHPVYTNQARDDRGNGLDWAESRRCGVQPHLPRCAMWTPPFVFSEEKLKHVLRVRAQRYIKHFSTTVAPEDWQELNRVATEVALRGHDIRPDAPASQHNMAALHIAAVKRAGGYLELQAAVAFRAWRLGQDSPTVANSVGLNPGAVRQILCRLKRIAQELGYETGAANHRRGAGYPKETKYQPNSKAEAEAPACRIAAD